jgi:hypothetical protein
MAGCEDRPHGGGLPVRSLPNRPAGQIGLARGGSAAPDRSWRRRRAATFVSFRETVRRRLIATSPAYRRHCSPAGRLWSPSLWPRHRWASPGRPWSVYSCPGPLPPPPTVDHVERRADVRCHGPRRPRAPVPHAALAVGLRDLAWDVAAAAALASVRGPAPAWLAHVPGLRHGLAPRRPKTPEAGFNPPSRSPTARPLPASAHALRHSAQPPGTWWMMARGVLRRSRQFTLQTASRDAARLRLRPALRGFWLTRLAGPILMLAGPASGFGAARPLGFSRTRSGTEP